MGREPEVQDFVYFDYLDSLVWGVVEKVWEFRGKRLYRVKTIEPAGATLDIKMEDILGEIESVAKEEFARRHGGALAVHSTDPND